MKDIELYNGDCIEVLGSLCDTHKGLVDCIITDPPYNISRETNFSTMASGSRNGMDFGEWDKDFDITKFISYASPLLKENGNVVILDLSGAKTQVEADKVIENYLLGNGLTRDSAEFAQQSMTLRNDNNVSQLPIR